MSLQSTGSHIRSVLLGQATFGIAAVNPFKLFRKNRPDASIHGSRDAARMTWAKNSISGTVQATNVFLRRNLWIWPIIAVTILGTVGILVRSAIEATMLENLRSGLQTLLDVEVAMLRTWFEVQQSNVQSAANSTEVRRLTQLMSEETIP